MFLKNKNLIFKIRRSKVTDYAALSSHSKRRPKIVFNTNYRLMQVKSIAECSKGSILQYFSPSLSYNLSLRSLFCLFFSGRLRQVILYFKASLFSVIRQLDITCQKVDDWPYLLTKHKMSRGKSLLKTTDINIDIDLLYWYQYLSYFLLIHQYRWQLFSRLNSLGKSFGP